MKHEEALALIESEYKRAVEKHGAEFSDLNEMAVVLHSEFYEVYKAVLCGDIHGRHGVKFELAQVAAVCLKALEGIA